MPCKKCNSPIERNIVVDGVTKRISHRQYCLRCSPYKEKRKTIEERVGECSCKICKSQFTYKKRYTRENVCGPCVRALDRYNLKQKLVTYKGGQCEVCGYNRCIAALEFHHRDPEQKTFQIGGSHCRKFEHLKSEVDKCVLLCANCHREQHSRIKSACLESNQPRP